MNSFRTFGLFRKAPPIFLAVLLAACSGTDLEISGDLSALEDALSEETNDAGDSGPAPEEDAAHEVVPEENDAGAEEADSGDEEEEDSGSSWEEEEDAGEGGEEDAAVVLVGCADPANEGQPCGEVTPSHACGVAACRNGTCTEIPGRAGTVCRAANGVCDAAEKCDGAHLDCPSDGYLSSSTVCRASAGGCDGAEYCTGTSKTCPADVFDKTCACPKDGPIAGYGEHSGLRAIGADKFVLKDTGTWAAYEGIIDGLGLSKVLPENLKLNHTMTAMSKQSWTGFKKGWQWASGDLDVVYWIPQGLGGGTSGGKTFRVIGWHYDERKASEDSNRAADQSDSDKGVRVSFVDSTDTKVPLQYRHVLLVEPDSGSGFKPVKNHAGGIAWSWPYLYVADTSKGVRAFDMARMLKVSTDTECSTRVGRVGSKYCAYGYAYVLPQTGGYYFPDTLSSSCKPKFSYIAFDRGGSGGVSILSGEYFDETGSNIYGRLFRWPMGSGGKMKTDSRGVVTASGAWYLGSRNIQGAVSYGSAPTFLLNSTRYSGALIVGKAGEKSRVLKAGDGKWAYMPEGMYITASDNLWVSTEGNSKLKRCIFYADVEDLM